MSDSTIKKIKDVCPGKIFNHIPKFYRGVNGSSGPHCSNNLNFYKYFECLLDFDRIKFYNHSSTERDIPHEVLCEIIPAVQRYSINFASIFGGKSLKDFLAMHINKYNFKGVLLVSFCSIFNNYSNFIKKLKYFDELHLQTKNRGSFFDEYSIEVTNFNKTSLQIAAQYANVKIVKFLIGLGHNLLKPDYVTVKEGQRFTKRCKNCDSP